MKFSWFWKLLAFLLILYHIFYIN